MNQEPKKQLATAARVDLLVIFIGIDVLDSFDAASLMGIYTNTKK